MLDTQLKSVQDESQALAIELRNASAGEPLRLLSSCYSRLTLSRLELAKVKSSPTDAEVDDRLAETNVLVFADVQHTRPSHPH